jgi:uncharacterized protein (TIGR02147 family)
MNSLFEYTDYRKFLADFYEWKKSTQAHFSHRSFLRKARINSPSFLKEVINGKKNLSASGIRAFSRALDLEKREADYFKNLVLYNQAKDASSKQRIFLKLSAFSADTSSYVLKKEQFEYFSHWYNVAIREYIHAHRFSGDYRAMVGAITPKITLAQSHGAVKLLMKLGLIRQEASGVYSAADAIVTFDPEVENLSAHTVHKSMQAISARALDTVPRERRYFRTVIGSFSEDAFHKIRIELDTARKRILDIIGADNGERKVFHVGMQLYPLEKKMGDEKK